MVSPFVLSHVCHAWRDITLADGRLWWNVSFNAPRLQALACIERSAPHTFDIHLQCDYNLEEQFDSEFVDQMIDLLYYVMQHGNRISNFLLDMNRHIHVFEEHLWPIILDIDPVFFSNTEF
jgi:hypothetical protein